MVSSRETTIVISNLIRISRGVISKVMLLEIARSKILFVFLIFLSMSYGRWCVVFVFFFCADCSCLRLTFTLAPPPSACSPSIPSEAPSMWRLKVQTVRAVENMIVRIKCLFSNLPVVVGI